MGDMSDLTIPTAEYSAHPPGQSSQPEPTSEAWFFVSLGGVALIEIVALAAWLGW